MSQKKKRRWPCGRLAKRALGTDPRVVTFLFLARVLKRPTGGHTKGPKETQIGNWFIKKTSAF